MKRQFLIILAILLSLNTITLVALADHVAGEGGGGSLSLTMGAGTFSFNNVTASSSSQTTTKVLPSVEIIDERDTAATLTVSVTVEDFSNGTDVFDFDNVKIKTDDSTSQTLDDHLTPVGGSVAASVAEVYPSVTTLTAFSGSQDANPSVVDTSNAMTIVNGDSHARIDRWTITPEVELTIPAYQPASTTAYTSTFTFTII